ncbi:MAG: hypothetical protein GXO74_04545 [Calditrichaeota bacterium]|nr:hypothetical protein [Calditrichota bacterium]
MAGFEGIKWATKQMRYLLKDRTFDMMPGDDKVYAVSRSIHYGLFLAFEGIRFFCDRDENGKLVVRFLNLNKNIERFRRGISFNLGNAQQPFVPSVQEITNIFLRYLRDPEMVKFLEEMADLKAQGYLRPFTVDETQSIGVTFPDNPSIRAVVCRYDQYLGEPFSGVVVPDLVRAVGVNGTGCLKLGINYLVSVKAVDKAKKILPEASTALLLDDRPYEPLESRTITEWDSSCALFALRDGSVIKIPESNLILPSVTIKGIVAILRQMGVTVNERDLSYGELIDLVKSNAVVAVCSVGTAGIMNRAQKLLLVDAKNEVIARQRADEKHELYRQLGEAKKYYWDIYRGKASAPDGLEANSFAI